jgi:hypothetical protein
VGARRLASLERQRDFSNGITTVQPWAIVRLHDRVQLQGWIPVVVEDRHRPRRPDEGQGTLSQIAGGLGDVGAAVRSEILKIGEYAGLPSLAVTVGAIAPTGRRIEETSPPLYAGTTGRGAWGGSLSVEAEYARLPWFVKVDVGVTGYLPFFAGDDGARLQYGPLLQTTLSVGRSWFATRSSRSRDHGEWEAPDRIDGSVRGSRAYQYTLAGSPRGTWPRTDLVGNVTNNVWPDGAGMNRDARSGFTGTLCPLLGFCGYRSLPQSRRARRNDRVRGRSQLRMHLHPLALPPGAERLPLRSPPRKEKNHEPNRAFARRRGRPRRVRMCLGGPEPTPTTKTSLGTAQAGDLTVELLSDSRLGTGMTPIYVKVTDAGGRPSPTRR